MVAGVAARVSAALSWAAQRRGMEMMTLPPEVLKAFKGRPHLTTIELAKAMNRHPNTLRELYRAGVLPSHPDGLGIVKPRRVFTRDDVEVMFKRIKAKQNGTKSRVKKR